MRNDNYYWIEETAIRADVGSVLATDGGSLNKSCFAWHQPSQSRHEIVTAQGMK